MNVRARDDAVPLDARERNFYAVMHHLAAALWMKGLATEALRALSRVLGQADSGGSS